MEADAQDNGDDENDNNDTDGNEPVKAQQDAIVFFYVPAFVAGFESIPPTQPVSLFTKVKFWIRHPAEHHFGYHHTHSVNLTDTPYRHCQHGMKHVRIDDHIQGPGYGFTTIGPCLPHGYGAAGAYLRLEDRNQALAADKPDNPTAADRHHADAPAPADETAIVKWLPTRKDPIHYHGFYASKFEKQLPQNKNLHIVYQPGHAIRYTYKGEESCQWRAPRKLWIPDNARLDEHPSYTKCGSIIDPDKAVYLERDYATYTAELSIPKKPSSAGEAMTLREPEKYPPQPRNLNVISMYLPGELKAIHRKIDHCLEVREGETLVEALSRYLDSCKGLIPEYTNLDIIGHSRAWDSILKLGEIPLTSRFMDAECARLYDRKILEALRIKNIRLLGCQTGCHPRGRRVVKTILSYFPHLGVYTARADLFAVHFGEYGLLEEAEVLLADQDVITGDGPGDRPPQDDYLAYPPADDDDDDSDDRGDQAEATKKSPDRLALSTLSDVNAAPVAACRYYFWKWSPDDLCKFLGAFQADLPEKDNPWYLADAEVIVPITQCPEDTQDFRSFDIMLRHGNPRVRIHCNGEAVAFPLKAKGKSVETADAFLNSLGIKATCAPPPPCSKSIDDASQTEGK
jgi:hypothetical protein